MEGHLQWYLLSLSALAREAWLLLTELSCLLACCCWSALTLSQKAVAGVAVCSDMSVRKA
jgi:hypothetical protein